MPASSRPSRRDTRDWWFVPAGGLTLLAALGAFLAIDDITTGRAPSLALEYAALAIAGLWGLVLAVGLFRTGFRIVAAICAVVLVAGWLVPAGMLAGFVLIALYLIGRGWATFTAR